jgi:hypothetical protein
MLASILAVLLQATPVTSTLAFQNVPVALADSFTVEWRMTPAAAGCDCITYLAPTTATQPSQAAILIRFWITGVIEARNGTVYAATTPLAYVGGTTYLVRVAVHVPSRRYTVTVTPPFGTPTVIAADYAFRESAATGPLTHWGVWAERQSHVTSGFRVVPRVAPPPPPPPVASVALSPLAASLDRGQTIQFTADVRDATGRALEYPVTWTSTNLTVLGVSANGAVTGVGVGTAAIRATSDGVSGTASVTVTEPVAPPPPPPPPPAVASMIVLQPFSDNRFVGDTIVYQAAAFWPAGGIRPCAIAFETYVPAVGTLVRTVRDSAMGLAATWYHATAVGRDSIRARCGDGERTANLGITVRPPPPPRQLGVANTMVELFCPLPASGEKRCGPFPVIGPDGSVVAHITALLTVP